MIKRLRLLLEDSAWFVPFLYGTGGIALTFITRSFGTPLRELLPGFIYLDIDAAVSILSSTFTSLMTMMTFSFSTILVVLTTYSSQFSPRTINNFLTNSSAKHTLGLFILTTVYGITNLFLVQTTDDGVVLAAGVSVFLVIASIWAFVQFVQTISVSVQAERLLSTLHREGLGVIHAQQDAVREGVVSFVPKRIVHDFEGVPIYAERTGYIRLFSGEKIERCDIDFESVVAVGDFVAKGDLLGYWVSTEPMDIDLFEIGENRSPIQDPSFSIEKLSEVALRAISPGINDPNTAIHAIHYIGDVLRELASLPDEDFVYSNGTANWHMKRKSLESILFESLTPMKTYGQDDLFVMGAVFEALRIARLEAHRSSHAVFESFIDYMEEELDWEHMHERERVYVNQKIKRARRMAT